MAKNKQLPTAHILQKITHILPVAVWVLGVSSVSKAAFIILNRFQNLKSNNYDEYFYHFSYLAASGVAGSIFGRFLSRALSGVFLLKPSQPLKMYTQNKTR